jgi:hypothetical protein
MFRKRWSLYREDGKGKVFRSHCENMSIWNHSGQNVPKLLIAIQLWKDDNLTRISEFHSKRIAQKAKKLAVGCWRDWLFKADFQCMGQFEPGGHTGAFSWNAIGLGWTDFEKCIPRSIHRSMFEFTICPGLCKIGGQALYKRSPDLNQESPFLKTSRRTCTGNQSILESWPQIYWNIWRWLLCLACKVCKACIELC